MPFRWIFLPLMIVITISDGCSNASKTAKSTGQSLSTTDEQIFIGDTIEKNYDPNVIMKRAESFFDKEDYAEAIIEYQHFLDLHRVHTLASYAQFKLAQSHFKQVRTIDRDIEPIYRALEAYEKLRRDYAGSRYETEAVDQIEACHRMIAQAYLFVGQFYYRRDAYLAAAHRFEAILKQYPDMDLAGDALYYLALTYKELGAEDWARERLMAFAERYPTNQHTAKGQKLLAALNAKHPTELVAQASGNSLETTTTKVPPSIHAGSSRDAGRLAIPAAATALSSAPDRAIGVGAGGTVLCRLGVWC